MMFRYSLLKFIKNYAVNQTRQSALFINGAKASEQFVYVTPHLDIPAILNDKEIVLTQLHRRKSNIDLNQIQNLWEVYMVLKNQKLGYETKKSEVAKKLSNLIKVDPNCEEAKKIKIQFNLLKENLKKLKGPLWSAEEAVMVKALKLPNALHKNTPENNKKVLFTHLSPPNCKKDHIKIGREHNLIDFRKNENYYLTGDAAVFELGAKFYFSASLKNSNFVQLSNPDFVKSLIVEGCGIDHTSSESSFILHHNEETKINIDSRVHLTGGGSLCSFMAYNTKNVLYPKVLPFKYFTMGRQYIPSNSKEDSLFHVSQASVVEVLGVTKTPTDLDTMLAELTGTLQDLYSKLGYHFRIILVPDLRLQMWESLRVAIEMFSTSLDSYVEIGNVSICGDYISKRLLFTYMENKEHKFTHILSGTVLNVPKFLACVLEQNEDFYMPDPFKVENWKF